MANVLTDLAADIFIAADNVGREAVGMYPSSTINRTSSERVAISDVVRSHFTQPSAITNRQVSMRPSEGVDQTVDNKTLTITHDKEIVIPFTGEDVRHLNNGSGHQTVLADQIEQAMRAIANDVEAVALQAAYVAASRAVGTAGTTPFASSVADAAKLFKEFKDNGAPMSDLSLVMDTTAGLNMRSLLNLTNINQSGDATLLRQGILLPLSNINMRESAQVAAHTKGTGTLYTSDTAGYAIGATAITLITGSGTVVAGDAITFAGDTNAYVVETGVTAPGVLTIAAPGLRQALPASAVALTVGDDYTANVALARSAFEIVMRPPSQPLEGNRDSAVDSLLVIDAHSGMQFDVRQYVGQGKATVNVMAAYGVKAWKPENIILLKG